MRLDLHPEVQSDVDAIMGYYASIGGRDLATNFYRELQKFMSETAKRPESFSIRTGSLRRVNLHRFPYHFLFRIVDDTVRILVVRHHRRAPSTGMQRL